MNRLIALWQYRGFIGGMVKREFESRYTRSLLGGLWSIINPLSMVFIYTVVFSQVMKAKLPGLEDGLSYGIYLCAGIITWEFFQEVVLRGESMFLSHSMLIQKISFPRSALPIIMLMVATINFLIILTVLILFLIVVGRAPGWSVLAMFPLLCIQQSIALGLGIILGTLNVFFRDVGHFAQIILRFWFWLTPIVYPITIIPEAFRGIVLDWNPVTPLIQGYQDIFLYEKFPQWSNYIYLATLGIGLVVLSLIIYKHFSVQLVDEL